MIIPVRDREFFEKDTPGWRVQIGKPFSTRRRTTWGTFARSIPATAYGGQGGPGWGKTFGPVVRRSDGRRTGYIDFFVAYGGYVFYTVQRVADIDADDERTATSYILPGPRTGVAYKNWLGKEVRFY